MSNVRSAVDDALYARLNVASVADLATGGVHNTTVPSGTVAPYVVFAWESETFRHSFGGREWQMVYRVAAIVPGNWPKAASAIDGAIDDLLDNQPLSVAGYQHYQTSREAGVSVPPRPEDGPPHFQVGARYRLYILEVE